MATLSVRRLGRINFDKALELQNELQEKRISNLIPDTLLLLEHPTTLTMGRDDDVNNILVNEDVLKQKGITLVSTDRGGGITWHGPGQVAAYSIFDLKRRDKDLHKFIQDLMEVIIRTLADYSIDARRDPEHVGVWVEDQKIAAIGVHAKKWVTKHGLALNVNPDLAHFSLIHPCGITDKGVTSMTKVLDRPISLDEVMDRLVVHFLSVFNYSNQENNSLSLMAVLNGAVR